MLELLPSVKIGYRSYKVTPLPHEATNDDGTDFVLGRHRWQGEIEICPHYQPIEVVNSMLHEICHGIVDVYGFKFDNHEDEERFVDNFSKALTGLFFDNPDLLKWMAKNLNAKLQKGGLQKSARS